MSNQRLGLRPCATVHVEGHTHCCLFALWLRAETAGSLLYILVLGTFYFQLTVRLTWRRGALSVNEGNPPWTGADGSTGTPRWALHRPTHFGGLLGVQGDILTRRERAGLHVVCLQVLAVLPTARWLAPLIARFLHASCTIV